MASLLWIPRKLGSQEKCPPESVLLPGSRLRGAAESHYPAPASELGNQNGKTSAPFTKRPVAALDFIMSRVILTKLSTNKMKADILHLLRSQSAAWSNTWLSGGHSNVALVD